MTICSGCGKQISGFSIGSQPATLCRECRKAKVPPSVEAMVKSVDPPRRESADVSMARPYVTLTLIALNGLVYMTMGLFGASWTAPSSADAIPWGADFGPLTFAGQWWRPLTSTFVHFGILHIGLNMWCLWDLGRSLEQLMGRKAFTLMYLACGVAASITSLSWNPWRVSAGASGAIFGVAGAFVSYLYLKKATVNPVLIRRRLKSLGAFIFYNLLYGAAGARIDNSAHLGGLVAGLILGAVLPPLIREAPEGSNCAASTMAASSALPIDGTTDRSSHSTRLAWGALGAILALLGGAMHAYAANISAARYGQAVTHLRSGNSAAAVTRLQEAVTLKPDLLFAQTLLGDCWLDQGEPDLAIAPLEKALVLAPSSELIETNLALAYLGAGRPLDAIAKITTVLERRKKDNWWGLFILGMAYGEIGNYPAASQNLRASIQITPDLPETREALARVEIEQGHLDEARAQYGEILREDPDNLVARHNNSVLAQARESRPSLNDLVPVRIPYQNLVMKSDSWPLFP